MKTKGNRKSLILLIVSVGIVWGIIVWKIFTGLEGENTILIETSEITTINKVEKQLEIALDYPDPFEIKQSSRPKKKRFKKSVSKVKSKPKNRKVEPVKVILWPEVIFLGQIKNVSTSKVSAMFQSNGQLEILHLGDTWKELELVGCSEDSAHLKFQDHLKWVKKKP